MPALGSVLDAFVKLRPDKKDIHAEEKPKHKENNRGKTSVKIRIV